MAPRMCSDNCPNAKTAKQIQCHGCKAGFHMKCYGLAETLAQPLMENANLKFLCDKCTSANSVSVKANVAALSDNLKEFATEFNYMRSTVTEMKQALHNVDVNLPPSVWFSEMHDTLNEVKATGASTAAVVNEIRSTCDPLANGNETNELLKALLAAIAPAAENNNKMIELLTDIRTASIAPPKLQHIPSYSVAAKNKRPRSPSPGEITARGPRNKRQSAIMLTHQQMSSENNNDRSSHDEAKCSFVISPMHPSTSVKQIKTFVTNKLGIAFDSDDVTIWSLAPRGRSLDELSFISFKVSSTIPLGTQLTAPEFWPSGTTIRQFEERSRKSIVSLPAQQSDQTNAVATHAAQAVQPEIQAAGQTDVHATVQPTTQMDFIPTEQTPGVQPTM